MKTLPTKSRSIVVAVAMLGILQTSAVWAKGPGRSTTIPHTTAAPAGGWHGGSGTSSHHKGVPNFAKDEFQHSREPGNARIGSMSEQQVQLGPKLPAHVISQFNSSAVIKASASPTNINGSQTELAPSQLDPRKDGPPHQRDSFRDKDPRYFQSQSGVPGVRGLVDQEVQIQRKPPIDLSGMKIELTNSQVGQRGDPVHINFQRLIGNGQAWRNLVPSGQ
jgi:hypothetical protein